MELVSIAEPQLITYKNQRFRDLSLSQIYANARATEHAPIGKPQLVLCKHLTLYYAIDNYRMCNGPAFTHIH